MPDKSLVRAHLHISGRVQGVFYRYSTCEMALGRGLVGWVRNLPDGRVEAVVEGEREGVEKLIAWCHTGPPGGRVDRVEVLWESPTGEFSNFRTTG